MAAMKEKVPKKQQTSLVTAKKASKAAKAGLTFPIARVNRYLKKNTQLKRVGGSAAVFMTAVVEYIASEILQVAGSGTLKAQRKTVSPQDLVSATRSDKELSRVFRGHSIFLGDKIANIETAIRPAAKA